MSAPNNQTPPYRVSNNSVTTYSSYGVPNNLQFNQVQQTHQLGYQIFFTPEGNSFTTLLRPLPGQHQVTPNSQQSYASVVFPPTPVPTRMNFTGKQMHPLPKDKNF